MLTYHDHTARLVAQSVPQGATVFEPTRHARRRPDAGAWTAVWDNRFDSFHKAATATVKILQLVTVEAVHVVPRLTQPVEGTSPHTYTTLKRPIQSRTEVLLREKAPPAATKSGIREELPVHPASVRGTCPSACSK